MCEDFLGAVYVVLISLLRQVCTVLCSGLSENLGFLVCLSLLQFERVGGCGGGTLSLPRIPVYCGMWDVLKGLVDG